MTNVICPECNSENAEFVPGSRCYQCGTPLKAPELHEVQVEEREDEVDIFCHKCDSQPHEDVVMIVLGRMQDLEFVESEERKYYCVGCWREMENGVSDAAEIFDD